jgi:hypothetical protein
MAQNYVLLERIELNASAASVTFSNIPQSGYTDLKVVFSGRDGTALIYGDGVIRFNGDTGSNYSRIRLNGDGSGAGSASQTTTYIGGWNSNGANSTANTFCSFEMYVPNYLSSNQKSVSIDCVVENNATTAYQFLIAGLWTGTAAINQVSIVNPSSSFVAGTTASLYGLAAVGTTPTIAPKASGGNITTDGTYWIHTFTSSGTFTPLSNLTCDYLVVAGGGGGGVNSAGGGGAGGFRTSIGGSPLSALAQSYTITVGAGGAGSSTNSGYGNSGTNSTFSTITSAGGGGGSGYGIGTAGGSGGGGGGGPTFAGGAGNTPSVSPSQGNNGGSCIAGGSGGGGGGGAGAVGQDGSLSPISQKGGNGGNGSANTITGSSVTYAGGGGGAGGVNGGTDTAGAGGTGGGGTGKTAGIPATNGTTNLGGGGGGGWYNETAGSGGSGVVIIRYAI